jgi:hypothetical protein
MRNPIVKEEWLRSSLPASFFIDASAQEQIGWAPEPRISSPRWVVKSGASNAVLGETKATAT